MKVSWAIYSLNTQGCFVELKVAGFIPSRTNTWGLEIDDHEQLLRSNGDLVSTRGLRVISLNQWPVRITLTLQLKHFLGFFERIC